MTRNTHELHRLANILDGLRPEDFDFDMRTGGGHVSGQRPYGCIIAVTGYYLLNKRATPDWSVAYFQDGVDEFLGLTEIESELLFFPGSEATVYPATHCVYDSTPQMAARVVRHFANTGEIDWRLRVAPEPVPVLGDA